MEEAMARIKKGRKMRLILLLLSASLLNGCSDHGGLIIDQKERGQHQERKEMTQKRFDIKEYDRRKKAGTTYFFLDDGTEIHQFDVDEDDELNYIERITPPPPSYFTELNSYYGDGFLKMSGSEFPRQFQAGVWREFDRQGKLTSEKNYDEPFEFDFKSLLDLIEEELVKKEGLVINTYDDSTLISRKSNSDGVFWYVKWRQQEGRRERIVVDGIKGEIIERGFVEWDE